MSLVATVRSGATLSALEERREGMVWVHVPQNFQFSCIDVSSFVICPQDRFQEL